MKTTDESIRCNISQMAAIMGVTHKKMAEAIGKDKATFSRIMSGKATLHARYIPAIAEALGCSCDDLLTEK
ncbi:MAG: helix-turn-helix transcriptional regulator [Clostridia bacterium]|nr:helix-turn-helix transcriptional regulator [Clostridia bacterium]